MLNEWDEEELKSRTEKDAMDCWPIIGSEVPERELRMIEGWQLEATIEGAVDHIRNAIKKLNIRDPKYVDEENGIQFKFLIDTMLAHSRTPEQISNMVNGYITFCVRECRQREFRNPVLDTLNDSHSGYMMNVVDFSCFGPQKMDILKSKMGSEKIRTLDEFSRNSALHTFTYGLAEGPLRRYAGEPGYDGTYMIMSDPKEVVHPMVDGDETVERKIPEDKRMTKPKLARLLQMPDLERYIMSDKNVEGYVVGTNLAIIAEYFCENNDVIYLNSIDKKMIDKWIRGKFIAHNPPPEVAFYVWARFQQTDFEETSDFIEQHILSWIKKEEPWIFKAAGREMTESTSLGNLFELLIAAVDSLKEDPEDPNFRKLIDLIPGKELVQIFTSSRNEGFKQGAEFYLKNLRIDSSHVTPEYSQERFNENPTQTIVDILNEPFFSVQEWKEHEGFEILDPFAIAIFDDSLRSWGIESLKGNIFKMIESLDISDLLVFRNCIAVEVTEPNTRKKLDEHLTTLIDKAYGTAISEGVNIEILVDMVRGEEVDPIDLLPSIKSLPPEFRRIPSADRLPEMAEKALIVSAFENARGSDEIIKFLMRNRSSMNVVELISPFPDAPNFEIIKQYGESPNLLLFLSISTILMYLGYSREYVFSIINKLVEKTEDEVRPELSTVGLEWEQVGGNVGEEIATDHFAELFNVLPQGGDTYCNEILSHPSTSADVQNVLMGIITDPRHGYMNVDRMWPAQKKEGVPLSSLHVNVGVPKDLDISSTQIQGYLNPVLKAAAISRGAKHAEGYSDFGYARRWATGSLLDTIGDKHPKVKLEVRSTALEEDGSHNDEIRNITMIASACMQHAKDANGKPVTPSGKVMGEIFAAFAKEVERLKFSIDQADSARTLLDSYAGKVRSELGV